MYSNITYNARTHRYCSSEIAKRILGEETKEQVEEKVEEKNVTDDDGLPYDLNTTLEHMKRIMKCRAEHERCSKAVKQLHDDIGKRLDYNAASATPKISATLHERLRMLREACEREKSLLQDDEETYQHLHARHREMKQSARKLMHESETVNRLRFEKLQRELAENTDALDMCLHVHDARRLKLVSQLRTIYPITISEDKNGARVFLIRGIALPDTNVYSHVEEQIATALGYVAHLVFMISKYLEIPLRYRLIHHASRSFVRDAISSASGGRGMNYPLFWKGGRREDFERAVSLLKQNIEQLMWARDVIPNAHGSKGILSNLYHFLNHILRS